MAQKNDLITIVDKQRNLPDNYSQVVQAHKRLNSEIDLMNIKIMHSMDKNESQFLIAYQNHIRKIKGQLAQLRKKADAHLKQMNQHQRANYLERQVIVFRQQSLKLYDRLQQKTQQSEFYKLKLKQLEKTCLIAQKQVKQNLKQRKTVQAKLLAAESKINLLQQELKNIKQRQARKQNYVQSQSSKSVVKNLNLRIRDQQLSKYTTPNKTTSQGVRRKSMNNTAVCISTPDDSQLKFWFLQCIKSIKKDVAQRKNSGEQLNFDYVKSIQDFKMVDKLRLLQKFMESQKLLVWMYQKVFPTRIAEVRDYLSKNNSASTTKKNSIQSQQALPIQMFDQVQPQKIEVILPKMNELKNKKSEVRNRISIKDGKLNLSVI